MENLETEQCLGINKLANKATNILTKNTYQLIADFKNKNHDELDILFNLASDDTIISIKQQLLRAVNRSIDDIFMISNRNKNFKEFRNYTITYITHEIEKKLESVKHLALSLKETKFKKILKNDIIKYLKSLCSKDVEVFKSLHNQLKEDEIKEYERNTLKRIEDIQIRTIKPIIISHLAHLVQKASKYYNKYYNSDDRLNIKNDLMVSVSYKDEIFLEKLNKKLLEKIFITLFREIGIESIEQYYLEMTQPYCEDIYKSFYTYIVSKKMLKKLKDDNAGLIDFFNAIECKELMQEYLKDDCEKAIEHAIDATIDELNEIKDSYDCKQ